MSEHELEQMLLVAIIENSDEQHTAAQEYATLHNLTQEQVNRACTTVTTFLRHHGVSDLFNKEKEALVKLQSFFRMILVRKKLRKKMHYWQRLAKSDSIEHIKQAEKIYKVINRPKKRRRKCPYI